MPVYGYCRISTPQQNIERQVRNIAAAYPAAHIVREVYTGTACRGRQELDKLLHVVQPGDTIVFDSVSRMSRSAEEGCALYETLYNRGVTLCFLKEPHINAPVRRRHGAALCPPGCPGPNEGSFDSRIPRHPGRRRPAWKYGRSVWCGISGTTD